jgi:hypothetical protein
LKESRGSDIRSSNWPKECIGEDHQDHTRNAVQNRIDNPENSQQMNVVFQAVRLLDVSHERFCALAANRLAGLYLGPTAIAEHSEISSPVGLARL